MAERYTLLILSRWTFLIVVVAKPKGDYMDRFLAMKERGETILFSELLAEIPSDDVLRVLFPPQKRTWKQLATKRGMKVLKLHLNGFRQPEIAKKLDLTLNQVAYASAMIKNSLYKSIPPYIVKC